MKRPAHGAFNGKGGSSSSSFAKLCGGSFRVGSGISPQKTRTFFKKIKSFLKKNRSFFKNNRMFLMLFYSYCITWQNTLFFFQKFQPLRKRPVHRLFG